jgi:hypothetical protein
MRAGSLIDTLLNWRFGFVILFVTVKPLKMTPMSKQAERIWYQRVQVHEETAHKYLA